jgi:hypothetical protein
VAVALTMVHLFWIELSHSVRGRETFSVLEEFVLEIGILDSTIRLSRRERACCPRGFVFEILYTII